jgi:hypothetical protein
MQIHELTKRRKPVDEGILSGIKDAFTAAKTGFQQGASAGTKSPNIAGAAGALGALTSPMAGAVASNQNALNAADKSRQAINKKLGLTGANAIQGAKRAAGDVSAASTQNKQAQASQQQVQKQVQTMTQTFVKTPEFADLSLVLPDAGKMLMVQTKNGGQYFKDDKGVWYAEAESPAVPPKQVPPQQTKPLDALISADQYKQVASIVGGVPPATKGKKPTGGAGAFNNIAQQTTAAPAATPTTASAAPAPALKEAAGGFNRRAIAIKQAKDLVAKNVIPLATKNKINPNQIASDPSTKKALDKLNKLSQATVSKIKSSKVKKQQVSQAFTDYATAALTSALGASGQGAPADNQVANTPASQTEKAMAVQTISKMTGQDGAKIAQAAETNPQVKQALATITKESLEQKLNQALLLMNEAQIFITKDIVVKTASGNYVKNHRDQLWYDPNGTAIDPVKYAEYIAKLDATPQAQARYQADAVNSKGSDTGIANAEPIVPPAPELPADPIQQMADQQHLSTMMRVQQVNNLNAQIQDTFNQLQNAKIFNTGQEDYLKDRMAALIAMKA